MAVKIELTEDDKNKIHQMHKSGLGTRKIAAKLNIPRCRVKNILSGREAERENIKSEQLKERDDYIVKLYTEDQLSMTKITEIVKINRDTIKSVLLKNNIEIRSIYSYRETKITEQDELDILKMYFEDDFPYNEICQKYHINQNRFYRILDKYNKKTRKSNDTRMVKLTPAQTENLIKLYKEFGYINYVCEEMNLTECVVTRILKENNIEIKPFERIGCYAIWIKKYGQEIADEKMRQVGEIHSKNNSGEGNPMYGRPSPQGSGNGYKGWYKGIFFRSLKELTYFVKEIENKNLKWESGEKKKYIVKYMFNNQERTYRADFIIENKYMIEIKPLKLHESQSVQAKAQAAIKFCQENNLEYKLVDIEQDFELIKELYLSGEFKPMDKYAEKFEKLYR